MSLFVRGSSLVMHASIFQEIIKFYFCFNFGVSEPIILLTDRANLIMIKKKSEGGEREGDVTCVTQHGNIICC